MTSPAERDAQIRAAVERTLAADERLAGSHVTVNIEDGTAYLGGSVEEAEHRARVEALARSVPGVEDVVNAVRVGSSQRGTGRWWDAVTGHDYEDAHEKIRKRLDDNQ